MSVPFSDGRDAPAQAPMPTMQAIVDLHVFGHITDAQLFDACQRWPLLKAFVKRKARDARKLAESLLGRTEGR